MNTSTYMPAILHIRSSESSISFTAFYCFTFISLYIYVLNVYFFYRQGYVEMNLLNLLRDKILQSFPDIGEKELQIRLHLAEELLKNLKH